MIKAGINSWESGKLNINSANVIEERGDIRKLGGKSALPFNGN